MFDKDLNEKETKELLELADLVENYEDEMFPEIEEIKW